VDCQSGFFPEEISPKRNFKFFQKKEKVVLEIFKHQDGGK
jgi:hypothetical protein